jgi:hypothetical protein
MSNYPNMSYCMNENTLLALRQVIEAMREGGPMFITDLSSWERQAFQELFNACEDFTSIAEELEAEVSRDFDDSMDGDHASALASAGFGTDEDYGYAGDDY